MLASVLVGTTGGANDVRRRRVLLASEVGGDGRQPRGEQEQARGPGPRPARRSQRTRGAAERDGAGGSAERRSVSDRGRRVRHCCLRALAAAGRPSRPRRRPPACSGRDSRRYCRAPYKLYIRKYAHRFSPPARTACFLLNYWFTYVIPNSYLCNCCIIRGIKTRMWVIIIFVAVLMLAVS